MKLVYSTMSSDSPSNINVTAHVSNVSSMSDCGMSSMSLGSTRTSAASMESPMRHVT
jgi:hypothetical protein